MACRANPICIGSVTATICMTPLVDQLLHPLAHGGLGQADRVADAGVRAAAVLLQLLDDGLSELIGLSAAASGHAIRLSHRHLQIKGNRPPTHLDMPESAV